jgi:hypothetical protein
MLAGFLGLRVGGESKFNVVDDTAFSFRSVASSSGLLNIVAMLASPVFFWNVHDNKSLAVLQEIRFVQLKSTLRLRH